MVVRVVAEVADGVGASDRVRLPDQVVGEPDVAVGVGAAELLERRARPLAHLRLVDAHHPRQVGVGLAALEQQLQGRVLIWGERHRDEDLTDWTLRGA